MEETELPPDPNLMESMRAVGYTIETAIADIVDNSITARSHNIEISFSATPEPFIAILDDGEGMDRVGLVEAMRLASRSPRGQRSEHDLGRFGLGLKTASLSQCRCLTVASKRRDELLAVRWSLDRLSETGTWALQLLDSAEMDNLPGLDGLTRLESGTLVVWTQLDQLHSHDGQLEADLDEQMKHARDHLALVFHRFIGQKTPPLRAPMSLRINGTPLQSLDPFLTGHRGTQHGQVERFVVRDSEVRVQPYTLPYLNKLLASDRRTALISGTLRDTQGFYIYRASRLVLWGTWFRLMPKDDLGKLARVQVDIPNSLDDLWSLDIKKSTAIPPPEIRQLLRRLADRIVQPSKRVHHYRGRPVASDDRIERLWALVEERGSFRYEINVEHPLVESLSARISAKAQAELREVIHALQSTFPVEDAYNRLASDVEHDPTEIAEAELADLAKALYESMACNAEALAQRLALVEPFTQVADLESFLTAAISE